MHKNVSDHYYHTTLKHSSTKCEKSYEVKFCYVLSLSGQPKKSQISAKNEVKQVKSRLKFSFKYL